MPHLKPITETVPIYQGDDAAKLADLRRAHSKAIPANAIKAGVPGSGMRCSEMAISPTPLPGAGGRKSIIMRTGKVTIVLSMRPNISRS